MPLGRRKPTAGEYILSFLGGALPGYIQGKQYKDQQDKLDEANAKKMGEMDKYVMDALKEDMKSDDPNIANKARGKFNTMFGSEVVSMKQSGFSSENPQEISRQEYDEKLKVEDAQYRTAEKARLENEYKQAQIDKANRPSEPLVKITIDPEERAYRGRIGANRAEAEKTLNSVNAIVGDVGDMIAMFDEIPNALKGHFAKGAIGRGAGFLSLAPSVESYYDTRQLTLANIAKKLGGEVGVLTDRDIARIVMSLPDVMDTTEAANKKKKFVYNYINRRVKAYQKTAKLEETGIGLPKGFRNIDFSEEDMMEWESEEKINQYLEYQGTHEEKIEAHFKGLQEAQQTDMGGETKPKPQYLTDFELWKANKDSVGGVQ